MSRMAEHYLGDRPYPETPGSKERTTSRDAAAAVAGGSSAGRDLVLQALTAAPAGLTADELAEAVGREVLYVRPRVSELRKLGLIQATKERRPNASGLTAKVWRVA